MQLNPHSTIVIFQFFYKLQDLHGRKSDWFLVFALVLEQEIGAKFDLVLEVSQSDWKKKKKVMDFLLKAKCT